MSMIRNKTITQTVTLGSVNSFPTYATPLTITSTGAILTSAGDGIYGGVAGYGTIDNAGKIGGGVGGAGIVLSAGGGIANSGAITGGGGSDGYRFGGDGGAGIVLFAGGGIANSGVITGGGGGQGSRDRGYGGNGGDGIILKSDGSVVNAGRITGGGGGGGEYGGAAGAGVFLFGGGGVVTNGSAGDRTALITGGIGIAALGTAGTTVTNFATIASIYGDPRGTAISFANAKAVLVLAGGSRLVGQAVGGGGTLDLAAAGGPGTLSGLGIQITGFAQYAVLAGADWTLDGVNRIGSHKTLTDAGRLALGSGGLFNVAYGGREIVAAGGVASGTVVRYGGREYVHGTASGDTVSSGGRQVVGVGGVANAVTVTVSGDQTVSSGGAASGTIVGSGGTEIVYAGGTTNATTISGGLVEVMSGAYVSGRLFTFSGGGTLQLDRSVYFKGQIAGFAVPDQLDLRDIAFVSGTTTVSFAEAASHTSGTLTVASGAHTAKLTLLGSYVTSQFTLTSDGHGGTLVTDPPVAGGGTAQTTFADIAPARSLSGAVSPGNRGTFLPGAIATNEQSHAGQILLATGPPEGRMAPTTIPCS